LRAEWLNILGAFDIRKEIFMAIIDEKLEDDFYDKMSKKFSLTNLIMESLFPCH